MNVRATDPASLSMPLGHPSSLRGARRVVSITFHFPPGVEVGAYSCVQIARTQPPHGWEPIVLTAAARPYQSTDRRGEPTAQVIRTALIPYPLGVS